MLDLVAGLGVAAILCFLAMPSHQGLLSRYRTLSQAQALTQALFFARSEAIRRGVRVTICHSASHAAAKPSCDGRGWGDGWIAFLDNTDAATNRPGVLDGNDLLLRVGEGRPSVRVETTATFRQWLAFSRKHQHEYDDKYNVVGVNFNNPSDSAFALSKAIAATAEFKVLVLNAYLNPASHLSTANTAFVPVKDFQGQAKASGASFIGSLPSFTRTSIEPFVWRLPTDAFSSRDWWQDGGPVRAGLMPTETDCVKPGPLASPGPEGSLYNGALTLQLVKRDTPASALESNAANQDPRYGWRLKAGERDKWLLAEYTAFWHHPANGCHGSRGWMPNPAQDTSPTGKAGATPKGSGDPTGSLGGPVSLAGIRRADDGVHLNLLFDDGSTASVPADGTGLRLLYRDGTAADRLSELSPFLNADSRATPTGPRRAIPRSGRHNWREFTPPWTNTTPAANTVSR